MATDFPYFKGDPALAPQDPLDFRTDTALGLDGKAYKSSKALRAAVNVALTLGQPLLVTGEPGTGKTELGFAVARELGLGAPLFFSVKSTSEARDLFYTFDAIGRLRAQQGAADALKFITYQALGRAILKAWPRDQLLAKGLITDDWEDYKPTRSLVIIDEIDKAPRDFPNDLLDEIANTRFRIPELEHRLVELPEGERDKFSPVVVITSNSERQLPAPFLRRCAYHHIAFPDAAMLREIVEGRVLPKLPAEASGFVNQAIDFFQYLRGDEAHQGNGPEPKLEKPPSTAELVNFVRVARLSQGDGAKGPLQLATIRAAISVLLKNKTDLQRGVDESADGLIAQWKPAKR